MAEWMTPTIKYLFENGNIPCIVLILSVCEVYLNKKIFYASFLIDGNAIVSHLLI